MGQLELHAAEWTIQCKGRRQIRERVKPGLYRVHWKSGGQSLAAIGCGYNGDNWIAPINWVSTATIPALEDGTFGEIETLELIDVE